MWIFHPIGFFSIVTASVKDKRPVGCTHVIRARFKVDLEQLIRLAFLGKPEIHELPSRDYPYRIYVNPKTVEGVLRHLAKDIKYDNFKNEVKKRQGPEREMLYHEVWQTMYDAEARLDRSKFKKPGRIFNEQQERVLTPRIQCDTCGSLYKHGERHGCAPRTK